MFVRKLIQFHLRLVINLLNKILPNKNNLSDGLLRGKIKNIIRFTINISFGYLVESDY